MSPLRMLSPLLWPVAKGVLFERWSPREVREIWRGAFEDYEARREQIPREDALGARLMVNLAALTASLYRTLRERGLDEADAIALTTKVTGRAYERMTAAPSAIARLPFRRGYERVKRATDLMRRFPFGAPGYAMVDVRGDGDVVAFDVVRCPVAEYFVDHGLAKLCASAFCDLDYPLAERWGATLERSETLAAGARRCDFRWRVASTAAQA